jgi:hypothetical protein
VCVTIKPIPFFGGRGKPGIDRLARNLSVVYYFIIMVTSIGYGYDARFVFRLRLSVSLRIFYGVGKYKILS